MSIPNDDARNRAGLRMLRGRYIRRAKSLLDLRSNEYRRAIADARMQWNERWPQYRITVAARPEGLQPTGLDPTEEKFWPAPFDQDVGMAVSWNGGIGRLCQQFWPTRYFENPLQGLGHPASAFVSACLLFYAETTTPEDIDRWTPQLTIELKSLPYAPANPWDVAYANGERDFYRGLVEELLGRDSPRLESIVGEARRAGHQAASLQFSGGRHAITHSSSRWWYVPAIPGMSAADLEASASTIAEHVADVFGTTPLDNHIVDLTNEGMSITRIADLLGIDQSTVKRARARRAGS